MSEPTQPVPGFRATLFTHRGETRRVFRAGTGPAVVVVHEVPGLHPGVIAFGQRLVDAGFTVLSAVAVRAGRAAPTTGAIVRSLGEAHSVLTIDLVDQPGHPPAPALDRVLTFLTERLRS